MEPIPTLMRSPRRTRKGWALLGCCFALCVIYAVAGYKILTPHYSEDYRRTFVTNEFGIYPPPNRYYPENFLAVTLGQQINFDKLQRYHLHFYSWTVRDLETVFMRRAKGKIFFLLRADQTPERGIRVTLMLGCSRAIPLTLRINGYESGEHLCSPGKNEIKIDAPSGLIMPDVYSEIEIARPADSWPQKLALWAGLRDKEVSITAFRIDVRE